MEKGLIALAAALSVMTGAVTGIGEAKVACTALEGIAKNPEAAGSLRSTMIIGAAISETCAIYGMLVAILLILAFNLLRVNGHAGAEIVPETEIITEADE